MEIKYTPSEAQDRDFFIHVHHVVYRPVIEQMFGWDENMQDVYAGKAFDEGGIYIVWYKNERIGVIGWDERPDCLWLKEVFLLPDYQNQGIGSQMVKESITKAKSLSKNLRLRTLKENFDAKRFYERLGFDVENATDIHWNMIFRV